MNTRLVQDDPIEASSEQPPGGCSTRGREWAALAALMAAFAVVFLAFYPTLPGIEDEVGFINQSLVWSRGSLSAEGAGFSELWDFIEVHGRHVPARHPGRSLIALPFVWFGGVRAAFLSGLLLHLGLTGLGALVLVRLGRSPLWAALLLFHPTLAIYSRTITADAAAGTGLLLAALAVLSRGRFAGVCAGLAVGLAAAMRYHAALALPIVAASFFWPRGRPHAWRDAVLCVAGGCLGGGLIVIYNLAVYGTPTEPFTGSRGFFSTAFFVPHAEFYVAALMTIWPAMLLAPLVDRSSLRWLVRGVCGVFLGFLTLYYFHDRGSSWIETAVVGQRLLQVALPIWIISYAGMLDDWVVIPLFEYLGRRTRMALAALACAGLLMGMTLAFARHQHHLNELRAARDALIADVPEGSLIVFDGALFKLVGIPEGVPTYRLRQLLYDDEVIEPRRLSEDLDHEPRPWFLATLHRGPRGVLAEASRELIARRRMEPVATNSAILSLYVSPKRTPPVEATPGS
jgi:hypothetical protein